METEATEAAEALENAGFRLTDTGGGIVQWVAENGSSGFMILTTIDGEQHVSLTEPASLGMYDVGMCLIESEPYQSLEIALRVNFGSLEGVDDDERSYGPNRPR